MASSGEQSNFTRLSRLLINIGTQVLRDVFDSIHPPGSLHAVLHAKSVHQLLKNLRSKRVLNVQQWQRLYPSVKGSASSSGYDITLLFLLLRNICHLTAPAAGWDTLPAVTDLSREADLVRIKYFRNAIYGHITKTAIPDCDFETYWTDLESILVRLGGSCYRPDIQRMKVEAIDLDDEEYYRDLLITWEERDDKLMEEIKHLQDLVVKGKEESDFKEEDAKIYCKNLKKAIQNLTELMPNGLASSLMERLKTDDIFTNLVMHHGRNIHLKSSQAEHTSTQAEFEAELLTGERKVQLERTADLFLDKTEKVNPKSILIVGNPGIGKTLFSQKLIRDWSQDAIFETNEDYINPDFRFAYLLTFRQLNMLADEKLSLSELLDRSSVLNENAMTNPSLMEFIIKHPEQLLLILDGFDECKFRNEIVNDYESKYPNDPRIKMSPLALVSKLLQKKILDGSTVMVTTRPSKVDEIQRLHFDRYVEITGFSESQVLEFVGKYFRLKGELKDKALNATKSNFHCLTFGRVPLMCYLMCIYMESHIQNCNDIFPELLTEFYSKVISCIETNYNKAILHAGLDKAPHSSVVKMISDKFSELAAGMVLDQKYSFDDEDLKKLNLTEMELTYLKSSSLISCTPVVKNSPFIAEITNEYSFSHLTFQEYFAARYFVEKSNVPLQYFLSEMVLQFMAGLLGTAKNETLMTQLLEYIETQDKYEFRYGLIQVKCLCEYNDMEFTKQIVIKNKHNRFTESNGLIGLSDTTDLDCKGSVMLLESLNDIVKAGSISALIPAPHTLEIDHSSLSNSGLHKVLSPLTHDCCIITTLRIWECSLNDERMKCLGECLEKSKITVLVLRDYNVTDTGLMTILHYCQNLNKLAIVLHQLTTEGKQNARKFCEKWYPGLMLWIR